MDHLHSEHQDGATSQWPGEESWAAAPPPPTGDQGSATGDSAAAKGKKKTPGKSDKPPLPRGSACSVCRRRKLRCDGTRPRCGSCARLGHACTWGDPIHEKLQDKIRQYENKIHILETELEQYRAGGAPDGPKPMVASSSSATSPERRSLPPSLNLPRDGDTYGGFHQRGPSSAGAYSNYSPDTPASLAPANGLNSATAASFYSQSPNQDSSAFPLPPHSAQPDRQAPHLQSFPYTMNHAQQPQLSDLMNSPPDATVQPFTPSPGGSTVPLPNSNGQGSPYFAQAPHPHPPSASASMGFGGQYDRNGGLGEAPFGRLLESQAWGEGEGYGSVTTTWGQGLPPLDVMMDLANIYFLSIHQQFPFLHRPRFLYSMNHPNSLSSAPSLSLIYAVLAIAAPYHDSPQMRAQATAFYTSARQQVESAINMGVQRSGKTIASLTVETVQALVLLTMIETGKSDHQRAFLSIGQAVRVSAMLGLNRMDEDRIEALTGQESSTRRLRPPALHVLPNDPLLLEECRRTMCTVFCLDRFESGTVGWPPAISELDIRLLLPCEERLFEQGLCQAGDNPLWWPQSIDLEESQGIKPGYFAWFVRVVWLGGRMQSETYRSGGRGPGGPWNDRDIPPIEDVHRVLEMDTAFSDVRAKLNSFVNPRVVNGPLTMSLIIINCFFINLHHLRVGIGLAKFPFNPSSSITVGSAEYSMQRCLEAVHSLHEILYRLAVYENTRTSLYRSRITAFTTFIPYVLFCIAFPAKFAVGDWAVMAASRIRAENVQSRVADVAASPLPSGDDVFGPALDDDRLALIDTFCDALDRMGVVWEVGNKFATMIRGDRARLASKIAERRSHGARPSQQSMSQSQHSGY